MLQYLVSSAGVSSQIFNTGFVQSWILEKVFKFAKQFSRPGQSLENGDKVWTKGKKFFFSKATTSALQVKSFSIWSNFIQSRPYVCSSSWKKLCSCIFKGLYWSPIWQLESGKRNYCFGKMYGKSVQFWICTKPVNNNF